MDDQQTRDHIKQHADAVVRGDMDADHSDPIPDEVWEEVTRHYDESELAGLVVAIAAINAWNRINAATRQITGEWVDQWVSRTEQASQAA
jgi:hypothetical protein